MGAGTLIGMAKHLGEESRNRFIVDAMSYQSSIHRQLGLTSDKRHATPGEVLDGIGW